MLLINVAIPNMYISPFDVWGMLFLTHIITIYAHIDNIELIRIYRINGKLNINACTLITHFFDLAKQYQQCLYVPLQIWSSIYVYVMRH